MIVDRIPALLLASALLVSAIGQARAAVGIPGMQPQSAATQTGVATDTDSGTDIRDIPKRAGADEKFVNDVIQRAQTQDDGSGLSLQLKAMTASIDSLDKRFQTSDYSKLPIQRLETLFEHWQFYGAQLDTWKAKIQKLTLPISDDAAELSNRKKYWQTLRTASADTLSPALLQGIDDILADIHDAENAISGPLEKLLDLNQKGNALAQKVEQGIGKSTQLVRENDIELLKLDAPNLWQSYQDPANSDGTDFTTNFGVELQYAREYQAAYSTQIAVLKGLYSLLLLLLLWLSWHSRKVMASRPELAEYRNTLHRPFSAWLVLAALGTLLLQDDLPLIVQQVVMLVIWIPILRLLPTKLLQLVGPWVYMSAVFYALVFIGYMLAANQFLFRAILLLTNLLMLATMLWLMRRSSLLIKSYSGIWLAVIKAAMAWGLTAMAIAIVCNLIGNVSMAEMLTQATINSVYLALFLYTSISVMAGFLLLVLKKHAEKLRTRTQYASTVIGLAVNLYKAGLLLFWLITAMNFYRIWLPLSGFGKQVVNFSIEIGKFSFSIGSLLLFPVTVYAAFWIAKTLRAVLREDVFPNMTLPRGVGNSVSSILYYAIIIIGVFAALAAAGFQISQLSIILGALSVGIGFGLQTVVNNFVSGLILMLERPVQPGDTIELSGTLGKVREIGMRATTLTTFDGADVVVPNGMLLSEKMINWTLSSDTRRIEILIGIGYGSDPEKVLALLSEIARSTKGVSQHPAPTALFNGFGESALNFSVRAWTTSYDDSVFIRSDMAVRIYKAITDAGIEIPLPQRDLHIRSMPPGIIKPLTGDGT